MSAIQDKFLDFQNVEVPHVSRLSNEVAHLLAKYALGSKTSVEWLDFFPTDTVCILALKLGLLNVMAIEKKKIETLWFTIVEENSKSYINTRHLISM